MKTSGALGPSVWVASDGRAGNAAQVLAIARALGEMYRWVKIAHINGEGHRSAPIELTPKGLQPLLPSSMWWSPLGALPQDQKSIFQPPWPTVFIGAGRKIAPYTRYIRQASQGKTLAIHVMNPQLPLDDFDMVVAPKHDQLSGDNVVDILGSPAYFTPDRVEDTQMMFADLADERGMKVAVILGGDSKSHKMTEAVCEKLEQQLQGIASNGARLRIVCSRRTPTHARVRFRAFAEQVGARFWESPSDGENPYLAYLLLSDVAIVTEDSSNMLSEAAYFGLPVHIAKLEGHNEKFARFHNSLVERGAARWFDGTVEHWTYPAIREIDRVADAIVEELIKRYPQPKFDAPKEARQGDFDRR